MHSPFVRISNQGIDNDFAKMSADPNQMRWEPLNEIESPCDFIGGLKTMGGNGDVGMKEGFAVYFLLLFKVAFLSFNRKQ